MLYFQQNEAPIPSQFHDTEKRHFSMHADARGSLILYILSVEISDRTVSSDTVFVPAQRHPLGSTEYSRSTCRVRGGVYRCIRRV